MGEERLCAGELLILETYRSLVLAKTITLDGETIIHEKDLNLWSL